MKREIAYHGDVLNTAARIQGVCNQFGKSLLISEKIKKLLPDSDQYKNELVGEIPLKGKAKPVKTYSFDKL